MLNYIQHEVKPWTNRNFPGYTAEWAALVLSEESGEVSRAVVKMAQGIRGTREEWIAELRKEMGDVIIALCSLANVFDMELEEVIQERWTTISARDWTADKIGQGI